mgnify:CR=1 FL=1
MKQLSRQGVRLLHALGKTDVSRITPMVGAEQEYFLVDYKLYNQRLDLKICGRTLFGAKPSKGQELDDHYCGRLRIRVGEFMQDLDKNLWEMGVASKTSTTKRRLPSMSWHRSIPLPTLPVTTTS